MSGSFGLTTPHPHFDCLDNLSTKTTWQIKAILCGQTLFANQSPQGPHTGDVIQRNLKCRAAKIVLSWFFSCSPFCKNLLVKLLSENVLYQAQVSSLPSSICVQNTLLERTLLQQRLFWLWLHCPECCLASE